jgi:hypothetical protein
MSEQWQEIGVVVLRRRLSGPWAAHEWLPGAILPGPASVPPWTQLRAEADGESFYAGGVALGFHAGETAHYRDNLESPRPQVWVQLRPALGQDGDERVELVAATVDPYEAEAMADSVGDVLAAFAMPAAIAERLRAFFAAHHVERVFFKRERKRADPDSLGRRGRIDRLPEED